MKCKTLLIMMGFVLTACGAKAQLGEECLQEEDCADGLECHMHDDGEEEHEEHGICEEHDEDDHEE